MNVEFEYRIPLKSLQNLAGESLSISNTLPPDSFVTVEENGLVRLMVTNVYVGFIDLSTAPTDFHNIHRFALEPMIFPRSDATVKQNDIRTPQIAEYLFFFFLDAENCDAHVGDLVERYELMHKKFGKGKADFWYWKAALSTTGPIMIAWMKAIPKKPLAAIASYMAAKHWLSADSWLVVLADLVKRIRN